MHASPDPSFLRKLKVLDPRLGCEFRFLKGLGDYRFVITYDRATGAAAPVWLVETDDNGFRPPDERDILALNEGDLHRGGVESHFQKVAHYYEQAREQEAREQHDFFWGATADNYLQLKRLFAELYPDGGKCNSAFRRITPKQRGQVF